MNSKLCVFKSEAELYLTLRYAQSSQTKLTLTHFYININYLLALRKYPIELFQKQVELLIKVFFGEVMRERNNWPLRTQYMAT